MFHGRRILGIITARAGSKRLPAKNIRPLAGKPLLAWTIEAAQQSNYLDRIICSTDCPKTMLIAKQWGCDVPFMRPALLSDDTASSEDVVLHALCQLKEQYDYIVLLQPTSPLRTGADIDCAINHCELLQAPSCVTVYKEPRKKAIFHEQTWIGTLKPAFAEKKPSLYVENGAVFVTKTEWFLRHHAFVCEQTVPFEMPVNRSIDIDTEHDFALADYLLTTRHRHHAALTSTE